MVDITKSIRLSITQNEQLEDDVKKYHFKNISHCLRVCHELFRTFMKYKDELNTPEAIKKFLEETESSFQAEIEYDRLEKHIGKMPDELISRIFFVMSQETNSRIQVKVKSDRDNRLRLEFGGELEPKVGYTLRNTNNYQFYAPIDPPDFHFKDNGEWDKLSHLNKLTLRDELKIKLSELEEKFGKDTNSTATLHVIILKINEQIKKENYRILEK